MPYSFYPPFSPEINWKDWFPLTGRPSFSQQPVRRTWKLRHRWCAALLFGSGGLWCVGSPLQICAQKSCLCHFMAADNDLYFTPAQQKKKLFFRRSPWIWDVCRQTNLVSSIDWSRKTQQEFFFKRDMSVGDVREATSLDLCWCFHNDIGLSIVH